VPGKIGGQGVIGECIEVEKDYFIKPNKCSPKDV
jgi:hypothetical protein